MSEDEMQGIGGKYIIRIRMNGNPFSHRYAELYSTMTMESEFAMDIHNPVQCTTPQEGANGFSDVFACIFLQGCMGSRRNVS